MERAAREAIDQHGDAAVEVLRERAEVADHIGDMLAAEAWRDIADAAERICEAERVSPGQRARVVGVRGFAS